MLRSLAVFCCWCQRVSAVWILLLCSAIASVPTTCRIAQQQGTDAVTILLILSTLQFPQISMEMFANDYVRFYEADEWIFESWCTADVGCHLARWASKSWAYVSESLIIDGDLQRVTLHLFSFYLCLILDLTSQANRSTSLTSEQSNCRSELVPCQPFTPTGLLRKWYMKDPPVLLRLVWSLLPELLELGNLVEHCQRLH